MRVGEKGFSQSSVLLYVPALMRISSPALIIGLTCSCNTVAAPANEAQASAPSEEESALHRAQEILSDAASKGYGGAVLIERDDQVVLRCGYGLANRERNLPFTPATISQIGSLTKQFTAAAVAALAQEKRINYSDSVGKYLAGDPRLRGITIHQLLTHIAGIERDCGRDFEKLTKPELLKKCIAATVQAGSAHKYKYSNLGYSLLGALVEQVSGQNLEAFLINRFLRPAGMPNTRYSYTGRDPGLFARGYAQGKVQPLISDRLAELDDSWWNLKGNGGMQSTLDDMYAWYRSFKDAKHITADMKREILAPQVPAENGVFYGYGWFVRVLDGGNRHVYSHTGGDGVLSAAIIWMPEDRLFFLVFSNSDEFPASKLAGQVIRAFGEHLLG